MDMFMRTIGLRSITEAGNLLSTYLLQGWVMTDEICPIEPCDFPLMRSKDGSLSFCTLHDPLPNHGAKHNYKSQPPVEQEKPPVEDAASHQSQSPIEQEKPLVEDAASYTSQPSIEQKKPLVEDAATLRHRREQSSRASQLIGQKMLQRWALLNEHCPNDTCYAIPLIRNPETKQMFCVICENYILSEEEALELEKKKKSLEKKEQPLAMREPEPKVNVEPKEQQSAKPVHSPIQPVHEERKRQKITRDSDTGVFASSIVVSTLSNKMNELSERVTSCHDPKELVDYFMAIKGCADAIKSCVEAGDVYDKSL